MVEIEFKGFNRVQNSLRKLASQMPQLVDRAARPWAQETRGFLKSKPYPAKRAGQRYVRTGRLANSWSAARNQPGVWAIKNSAPYSVYVVGNSKGQQARNVDRKGRPVFIGRWWIAVNEIGQLTFKLTAAISKELRNVWEAG